jgi:hypothetical protein
MKITVKELKKIIKEELGVQDPKQNKVQRELVIWIGDFLKEKIFQEMLESKRSEIQTDLNQIVDDLVLDTGADVSGLDAEVVAEAAVSRAQYAIEEFLFDLVHEALHEKFAKNEV